MHVFEALSPRLWKKIGRGISMRNLDRLMCDTLEKSRTKVALLHHWCPEGFNSLVPGNSSVL